MSKYIDKTIYINLNRRNDKRIQIEKELVDFDLNYERFEAIENDEGCVGCAYSHLNVLKLAKERGYKNVLILEDDFTFLVSKEEFEKQLTIFFKLNINYDVCKLSYNLQKFQDTEYDFLLKVLESQTASGYIVNSHYYDKLILLYEWAIPLLENSKQHWIYANDQVWKRYQESDLWYCFKTRIGKQRDGISDNSNSYVIRDC